MLAVVQRVSRAHVEVDGQTVGAIGAGLLVLVCAEPTDTPAVAERLLGKLLRLRIFADAQGRMNRCVQDLDGRGQAGGLLLVSQFTLAADTSRGNRPGFSGAAPPEQARVLFDHLVAQARVHHPPELVHTGQFGADMQVHLVNDGPVTLPLRCLSESVQGWVARNG
ncbi:MAG: D-aminoacyl-tRNA deacylase [Rhodoferax sp.]